MLSAVCALCLGWPLTVLDLGYYGQPSAVVWKDQIFVYVAPNLRASEVLYRAPLARGGRQPRPPVAYGVGEESGNVTPCSQAKLDIRDGRVLWFSAGYFPLVIPLADLPCLENGEFGVAICKARFGQEQYLLAGRHYPNDDQILFPKHRKPDVPAPAFPGDNQFQSDYVRQRMRELEYRRYARFDVQIAGPRSVRLFHAHKGKLFVSVEPDYLRTWYLDPKTEQPKKNQPKPPERELRTGKLPADFTERFAAYTADKRDYLVTINGKAYMAVPNGKDEVEVTKVWADPKRRIVGVVQDQANDAVYGWGFVTDSAAPERFYVKLAPKPVAVPYKRTVPLWGNRSDAYLESYECARAFRKDSEKK